MLGKFMFIMYCILTGLERLQESPCPLTGEYTGIIPDASNLCARLSSDCKSPEIMYYMVSDCSHSEIYEGKLLLLIHVHMFVGKICL